MKVKKIIISLFVILLTIIVGLGQNFVLATSGSKTMKLSYARQLSDGTTKGAYALNNSTNHNIYQIKVEGDNTINNLFCLDAEQSYGWNYHTDTSGLETGSINEPVTYDNYYNMATDSDFIKSNLINTYAAINNSEYLGQIAWILDNMYISKSDNDNERIELLKKAKIKKTKIFYEDPDNDDYFIAKDGYAYVPDGYEEFLEYIEDEAHGIKEGDHYKAYEWALEKQNRGLDNANPEWMHIGSVAVNEWDQMHFPNNYGYSYINSDNETVDCDLPTELVEAVEQAALWYYTEFKIKNNNDYNFKIADTEEDIENWLKYSVNSDGDREYNLLSQYVVNPSTGNLEYSNTSGTEYSVGLMYQEQACLLYNYLIDAAEEANKNGDYATKSSQAPLTINSTTSMRKVGDNYVVGPINITKQSELPYILNNSLVVKDQDGNSISNWKFSDSTGNEISITDYSTLVNRDGGIYIKVPTSGITGVDITFSGEYNTTTKKLWIKDGVTDDAAEQLIVEVEKEDQPLELNIEATTNPKFDLALRKAIVKITDAAGTKNIINENGVAANRVIDYDTSSLSSGTTATYKHRKDPVMVKKGDKVTYRLTVYNEGDQAGYPTKIVDQLPSGLVVPGGATTGTYKNGNIEYTYTYDSASRKITFTNVSNNILDPYNGGTSLDSESIEIELEVTEDAGTNGKYKYLTNIAYIAEEYNSEEDKTITTTRGEDRDSEPGAYPTSTLNTEAEKNGYNGYKGSTDNSVYNHNDGRFYYEGEQDDDDFEIIAIKPEQFDLKLVKFISKINEQTARTVTAIDTSDLKTNTWERKQNGYGNECSADYTLSKDPLKVKTGDYVTYTLRVYNEGDLSGYAEEITENIPTGLEFVYDEKITIGTDGKVDYSNCTKSLSDEDKKAIEFNLGQGWSIKTTDSSTGRITETKSDLLSRDKSTSNLIKAFDYAHDDGKGSGLSYKDIQIKLKVIATDPKIGVIRNEAAITDDADENGNDITDRDSEPENWPGKNDHTKYQDDEDYDNVILAEFDLALRKFIAAVSKDINIENGEYLTVDGTVGTEYTREPVVDTSKLKSGDATTAIYKHPKDAVTVAREDYVLYTIRVYNEGDVDGYAAEITDHLPTYLDYVECEFNDKYGWKVASDGKTVSTTYLSSEKSKDNVLKAFDSAHDDGKGSGLSYKDVQILCKVNKNAIPMKNITNIAEIDEYQDEDGNEVPSDRDSDSDSLTDEILEQDKRPEYEGGEDTDKNDGYVPGQEDDDDFERIIVREFDLALLKYVSEVHVIEDGKETVTQTGNTGNNATDVIPKVEIYRKSLNSTVVKFVYTIKITNEGDIPGYATEITDYVPEGLKFYEEDNSDWVDEGNNVISTRALKGTLLNPGESATVTVTFRWINGGDNLGTKTNYAEISEDFNEYGIPDRDSTPDNKIIEEDDMDYAQVILSISTGLKENITLYVTLSGISLAVLASGIILIKKYVL